MKLREEFEPTLLVIHDDSHKHAGHAGMEGKTPVETHFRIEMNSTKFVDKVIVKMCSFNYCRLHCKGIEWSTRYSKVN